MHECLNSRISQDCWTCEWEVTWHSRKNMNFGASKFWPPTSGWLTPQSLNLSTKLADCPWVLGQLSQIPGVPSLALGSWSRSLSELTITEDRNQHCTLKALFGAKHINNDLCAVWPQIVLCPRFNDSAVASLLRWLPWGWSLGGKWPMPSAPFGGSWAWEGCAPLYCALTLRWASQLNAEIWKARPGPSCFSAPPSPGFVNNEVDDIFWLRLRPSGLSVGSNVLLLLIHQKREGLSLQDGSSKQSLWGELSVSFCLFIAWAPSGGNTLRSPNGLKIPTRRQALGVWISLELAHPSPIRPASGKAGIWI